MMLEDELRQTFQRAEGLVGEAEALLPRIDAATRRRRIRRGVGRATAAALAVVAVIALPTWVRGSFDHEAEPAPLGAPSSTSTGAAGAGLNIVIAGVDTGVADQRAEAIVIVHVPADRGAVYLVTIPRDATVEIPGHGSGKINGAYSLGRTPLLLETLTALTGLSFNGSVLVTEEGVVSVVTSLGGLNMCLDVSARSLRSGRDYQAGCRHFSSDEVVDILALREELSDGSIGRDRHAAQVLSAIAQDVTAAAVDPAKMAAVVRSGGAGVTIDAPSLDVAALAWELRGVTNRPVRLLPPWAINQLPDGTATMSLTADAAGLFNALRSDTVAAWVTAHPDVRTN